MTSIACGWRGDGSDSSSRGYRIRGSRTCRGSSCSAMARRSPLVAGAAGLTQLTPDLQRCVWRDDGEAIADVDVGPRGLLGAGERLCLWSRPGGDPVRWEPESLGLYAPPVCVRWHPDQRSAAVA